MIVNVNFYFYTHAGYFYWFKFVLMWVHTDKVQSKAKSLAAAKQSCLPSDLMTSKSSITGLVNPQEAIYTLQMKVKVSKVPPNLNPLTHYVRYYEHTHIKNFVTVHQCSNPCKLSGIAYIFRGGCRCPLYIHMNIDDSLEALSWEFSKPWLTNYATVGKLCDSWSKVVIQVILLKHGNIFDELQNNCIMCF